jgi:hypothetical protein
MITIMVMSVKLRRKINQSLKIAYACTGIAKQMQGSFVILGLEFGWLY